MPELTKKKLTNSTPDISEAEILSEIPKGYILKQKPSSLRPEFMSLYRRMSKEQWQIDDGSINWSLQPIIEDFWILKDEMREIRAHFVADCFYAEEFSMRGSGKRMDQLEEMDEKLCYSMMIQDEYRHAEVMGRYQNKLGLHRHPDPRLVSFFEWSETLDVEAFCIVSLVGETFALPVFPSIWRSTRDPLLRAFLPKICKDEKRHILFMSIYLASRSSRWTAKRKLFLSKILQKVYDHQVIYALEPNPLLTTKLSRSMNWILQLAGKAALKKANHRFIADFSRLGLTLPPAL